MYGTLKKGNHLEHSHLILQVPVASNNEDKDILLYMDPSNRTWHTLHVATDCIRNTELSPMTKYDTWIRKHNLNTAMFEKQKVLLKI